MKIVKYIVFRYLTNADYFNIYKPLGTEEKGGGQSYIDFGTGSISPKNWEEFFAGIGSIMRTQGPSWKFIINSIGLNNPQSLIIYQRRPQSFVIGSQRITSRRSNRVKAWVPQYGFPAPEDSTNRTSCPNKLAIYIVRTDKEEFWAGWFQNNSPCRDRFAASLLKEMIPSTPPEGCAGFLSFGSGQLLMDERDSKKPFIGGVSKKKRIRKEKVPTKKIQIKRRLRSEEEISKSLLEEDKSNYADYGAKKKAYIRKIISRNNKAVKDLKDLYQRKCQIIGDKLGFKKKDGTPYCEAHHCIPLGEKGADSPYNIIIVNPLIHRMLHYAEVSEIDLSMISKNNTLDIVINGQTHTIKWHPDHAKIVKKKLFEK